MRVTYLAAALLVLTLAAPAVPAQVAKLLPVDEATEDPTFFLFRSRLISAVAAQDTTFLYEHLAPDITTSFGGEGGIEEFKEMWQPHEPDSRLWSTLARILSRGGTFSRSLEGGMPPHFAAPYTYAAFPGDLDAYEHGVVVGENVRVRSAPNRESTVLTTLSYDVVRVTSFLLSDGEQAPPDGWARVELRDGQPGFMAAEFLASPLDYRAGLEKRDGRWLMTFLVAGD